MSEYQEWAKLSELLADKEIDFHFRDREIWWCHFGKNIGHEQDGKNDKFERPVLILKKVNKELFIGVPLTTKYNLENYKIPVGLIEKQKAYALIEQFRVMSPRRLIERIGFLNEKSFHQVKVLIKESV